MPFERRHAQLATERRLPGRQLHLVNQVIAFNRKIGMARQANAQKKIAAFSAACPRFALAGEPNPLPLVHTLRDLDLITFDLVGIPAPQRDLALRAVERLLERNHDVGFDVAASLRPALPLTERTATTETGLPPASEKRLKKIAETRAAEFEVDPAAVACRMAAEAPAGLRVPSRRRLKSARLIPVGAQFVVFLPLFRIAQDLVSLINLLKFLFRGRLVLVDVGMILARELSERFANLIVARRFRNAERFVVISELNCHLGQSFGG